MNAQLLKSKMVAQGKTQKEVAQEIGISENSMSRKLAGLREFKLGEIDKLCKVLNIENPVEIFLSSSSQIGNETPRAG